MQPAPGTPGSWGVSGKGDTFYSKRDNPVLRLDVFLRPTQESARAGDASLTHRYGLRTIGQELDVMALGNAVGAPYRVTATHEAHGLRLRKDTIEPISLMRDDWDASESGMGTTHFHLDPSVRLVPVRVVELHVDPATTPPGVTCPGDGIIECGHPGWIGEEQSAVVFDDLWYLDVDRSTNPSEHPHQVATTRMIASSCTSSSTCEQPPESRPDTLFEDCGVQSRMTEFYSCAVPYTAYRNTNASPFDCRATGNVNNIDAAIRDCGVPTAKAGMITVVYVGSLTNPAVNCYGAGGVEEFVYGVQTGSISSGGGAKVYMSNLGHFDDVTLSHEIGHALGLGHVSTVGNLMHISQVQDGPALTSAQCDTAYTHAGWGHAWW